jgi:hypothetical protein
VPEPDRLRPTATTGRLRPVRGDGVGRRRVGGGAQNRLADGHTERLADELPLNITCERGKGKRYIYIANYDAFRRECFTALYAQLMNSAHRIHAVARETQSFEQAPDLRPAFAAQRRAFGWSPALF